MRALPVAATLFLGLTVGAAAQMMGPGMGFPGAGAGMPGFNTAPAAPPPQQRQEPPCMAEFAPMRAEAEKRANSLKAAMQRVKSATEKRGPLEEACGHIKSFAAAEAKVVNFVTKNAQTCGIPQEAVAQMKQNHGRTIQAQNQICNQQAGPVKPSGPGLSEALGTARGGTLDPLAPQSGALDTLTGNVLSR